MGGAGTAHPAPVGTTAISTTDHRAPADAPTTVPQQSALFAWIASLVVIVAVVAASYVWRANVMQVWPPSQRALPGARTALRRLPHLDRDIMEQPGR